MKDNRVIRLDNKHSLTINTDGDPVVVKRLANGNLQPIPENEPVILFRARDKLALKMLGYYRELCRQDGVTVYQLVSMDDMIQRFADFAAKSETMKQPGCTKGK